jgi:hypothetical protein
VWKISFQLEKPTVQLNSIFSAKTDPRENPEKNPAFIVGNLFNKICNL